MTELQGRIYEWMERQAEAEDLNAIHTFVNTLIAASTDVTLSHVAQILAEDERIDVLK